jgi:hypothetical protein
VAALQLLRGFDPLPTQITSNTNLSTVNWQLQRLADQKDLHDELHRFSLNELTTLSDNVSRYLSSAEARREFYEAADHLPGIVLAIRVIANERRVDEDVADWVDDLEGINKRLRKSMSSMDQEQLEEQTERLATISGRLPLVNERLQSTAREVKLDGVAAVVRSVADHRALSANQVRDLRAGSNALHRIAAELTERLQEHNQWQALDSSLRELTIDFDGVEQEAPARWERLRDQADALCASTAAPGETEILRARAATLDEAITCRDAAAMHEEYGVYLNVTGALFLTVDAELRRFCGRLRSIGKTLGMLLADVHQSTGVSG